MTPSAPPRRATVASLSAALLVTTAGVLPGFLCGALAVQIQRELSIGDATFGLIVSTFFVFAGLAAIHGGRLADRLGWRRSLLLASSGSIATLLGVAAIGRSTVAFAGLLVLGGTTMGVSGPTGNLILAEEMPEDRMGLVFGIKQSAIPLATMFAGLAVPSFALTVGWRWAFVGATIFPAAAWLVSRRRGRVDRRAPAPAPAARPGARRVEREVAPFAVAAGLATLAAGALATFLVASSVSMGMAEATAGFVIALASGVGLTVRILGGWLADRHGARGFGAVSALMILGAVGLALLATGRPALIIPGAVLAFGGGWSWAGLLLYGVVRENPGRPATATGTIQVGSTTGVAVAPLAFGFVAEHAGYTVGWGSVAIVIVGAAMLVQLGARSAARRSP